MRDRKPRERDTAAVWPASSIHQTCIFYTIIQILDKFAFTIFVFKRYRLTRKKLQFSWIVRFEWKIYTLDSVAASSIFVHALTSHLCAISHWIIAWGSNANCQMCQMRNTIVYLTCAEYGYNLWWLWSDRIRSKRFGSTLPDDDIETKLIAVTIMFNSTNRLSSSQSCLLSLLLCCSPASPLLSKMNDRTERIYAHNF